MRVLVTGGSGFIGARICRDLMESGHSVSVLARGDAPARLAPLMDRIAVIRGDLADSETCADIVASVKPQAIVHAGWQGVFGAERDQPSQVRNIGWTADLVEFGRDAGTDIFIGLGSQAEYGPSDHPLGSESPTRPTSLYGECKLAAGRVASRIADAAGMRFVWLRILSVYGPGDHPQWMIPQVILSLLRRERPKLTPGGQLWDFLHVTDAARAVRLALEAPQATGNYALGSGHAPTLRSTIETIRDEIDPALPLGFGDVGYGPNQIMRLQADTSALSRDLGWTPRIDLDEGLAETVAWYRANPRIFEAEPRR